MGICTVTIKIAIRNTIIIKHVTAKTRPQLAIPRPRLRCFWFDWVFQVCCTFNLDIRAGRVQPVWTHVATRGRAQGNVRPWDCCLNGGGETERRSCMLKRGVQVTAGDRWVLISCPPWRLRYARCAVRIHAPSLPPSSPAERGAFFAALACSGFSVVNALDCDIKLDWD